MSICEFVLFIRFEFITKVDHFFQEKATNSCGIIIFGNFKLFSMLFYLKSNHLNSTCISHEFALLIKNKFFGINFALKWFLLSMS